MSENREGAAEVTILPLEGPISQLVNKDGEIVQCDDVGPVGVPFGEDGGDLDQIDLPRVSTTCFIALSVLPVLTTSSTRITFLSVDKFAIFFIQVEGL